MTGMPSTKIQEPSAACFCDVPHHLHWLQQDQEKGPVDKSAALNIALDQVRSVMFSVATQCLIGVIGGKDSPVMRWAMNSFAVQEFMGLLEQIWHMVAQPQHPKEAV